jgi:hypothetical protein
LACAGIFVAGLARLGALFGALFAAAWGFAAAFAGAWFLTAGFATRGGFALRRAGAPFLAVAFAIAAVLPAAFAAPAAAFFLPVGTARPAPGLAAACLRATVAAIPPLRCDPADAADAFMPNLVLPFPA